ncbi:MAG: hypothetical protein N4A41_00520 [Crocinitomicaceae bacterium]|jgi:hypothetical protein|nr:hypothetical protein [Crocinitomicaceae bacterium]
MSLGKAISPKQLAATKFKTMNLPNPYKDLIGTPELSGTWIIWGHSGNGKTRLALELSKVLTSFGRVWYNSLEEGQSLSIQSAFAQLNMEEVSGKISLLNGETIEDLKVRLRRKRSADIIVIDSLQYTGLNYKAYTELKDEFPKKLFVFVSHADGKEPAGRVAKAVRYDSNVKIHVEGYKAEAATRYGGGKEYIIWKEGNERFNKKKAR